jgi:hypothetical protein
LLADIIYRKTSKRNFLAVELTGRFPDSKNKKATRN